jgi:hypothetical protein
VAMTAFSHASGRVFPSTNNTGISLCIVIIL